MELAKDQGKIRTGVTYVIGASVSRRLTDRIRVDVRYDFEDRHADGTAFGPLRWAWRLDANAFIGALGLDLPIGRNQSVDLLAAGVYADGEGANRYTGRALSAAYLLRF